MNIALSQPPASIMLEETMVSFCSLLVHGQLFGIDTGRIREVLGRRQVEAVPLAPSYIAGIVPYRGEVLTAVCLRAVLGMPRPSRAERQKSGQDGCVLVLDEDGGARDGHTDVAERFGLVVDAVGGVITVERSRMSPNPSTLDEIGKALFHGAARTAEGLLVRLDPHCLNPARLAASGMFQTLAGTAGGEFKEN